LEPLPQSACEQLMSDHGVSAHRRNELLGVAGGNPFYVHQLAIGTAGVEWMSGVGGSPIVVPRPVLDSLAAEVSALSDVARSLAQVCAAVGEPVDAEFLCEVTSLDRDATLRGLDELVACDLLRRDVHGFAFRHPLVREAVYSLAPPSAVLSAHAEIARVLERRGSGPGRLAVHLAHSAQRGDQRAVSLLSAAAREVGGHAPQTAARWVELALGLVADSEREVRLSLLEEQGSHLAASGNLGAAVEKLDDALRNTPTGEHERRARLIAQRASIQRWLGALAGASESLARELAQLPLDAAAPRAELLLELAIGALDARDYSTTGSRAMEAIEAADRAGDPALAATAAAVRTLGCLRSVNLTDVEGVWREASTRLRALTTPQLTGRLDALLFGALNHLYATRFDEALSLTEQGLELARQSGQVRHVAAFTMMLSIPLQFLGRIPESLEAADSAIELARLLRNPHFLVQALWVRASVSRWSGDFEAGLKHGHERSELRSEYAPSLFLPLEDPGGTLGYLTAHAINPGKGLRMMVAEMGGTSLKRLGPSDRFLAWLCLTEVALEAGDEAAVEGWVKEMEAAAAPLPRGLASGWAKRARARLELARKRPQEALIHARAALEDAHEVGLMPEIAAVQILIGQAQSELEQRDEAIVALRTANDMLDGSGCVRLQDQCMQTLRSIGYDALPRHGSQPAALTGLTSRETELAQLVTAGLTNRKIADSLFISEKTVESHLRNIFRKLGVGSRLALARVVEAEAGQPD
jgi:DNA-binding CsgD family transcriptional regulator/tetratricopeptide (TPR) repeat protein